MGLPTPETLRSGFTEGLRRWKLRKSQAVEDPGYVSVRLVVAEPGDAGSEQDVFLSATALGTDTLLCASLRGASDAAWTPSSASAATRVSATMVASCRPFVTDGERRENHDLSRRARVAIELAC
jgi:hypothetical protein